MILDPVIDYFKLSNTLSPIIPTIPSMILNDIKIRIDRF